MNILLVAGTEHGVVTYRRSSSGGWDLESQALKRWEVEEVAAVPGETGAILAATRGDGVWLSHDAGKSWTKPSYGRRGPGKVRSLALDPRRPGRIYAGGEPIDIWVSDDLGATWDRFDAAHDVPAIASVTYPVADVEPHVRDITIDPIDPDTIYAALQVGYMLKTADGGVSWTLLNQDVDPDIHSIAVDPSDPKHVLVATGGEGGRRLGLQGRALYASIDGGESWQPTAMEFEQRYSVPLAMHPRNANVLFSSVANGAPPSWRRPSGAEGAIIRTLDGAQTWQQVDLGLTELRSAFASAIDFDAAEPDHVYAALNTGDVVASHDGGDSWVRLLKIDGMRVFDLRVLRD